MSALSFRAARPDDADAVVPLMHESSRGLIDASFDFGAGDAADFLRHDFLRGGGLFGFRNQMVVIADGRVIASATVYPGRDLNRLSLRTTRSALAHFSLLRFSRVVWRSLALTTLFAPPRRDSLFLANACVAADQRGRGVFSALLAHLRATRDPALIAVELDVSFGNPRAQQLYQRLGFVVTGERPYRGKRALDGFRRMQLAL